MKREAPVAQGRERMSPDHEAAGSSPAGCAAPPAEWEVHEKATGAPVAGFPTEAAAIMAARDMNLKANCTYPTALYGYRRAAPSR